MPQEMAVSMQKFQDNIHASSSKDNNHDAKPASSDEEPEVITSPVPVNFVLEIAAGRATKLKLKKGS